MIRSPECPTASGFEMQPWPSTPQVRLTTKGLAVRASQLCLIPAAKNSRRLGGGESDGMFSGREGAILTILGSLPSFSELPNRGISGLNECPPHGIMGPATTSEDSRMVRNLIRNQAPGNRLRVRIPCPPLQTHAFSWSENALFLGCTLRPTRLRLQPI